jgi:acetyltransferase
MRSTQTEGTHHCTSDGVLYRIRPIRPDDAGRERDFIAGLSAQSRYQRFMHMVREPGEALIRQFVNVDGHRTMALVAVVDQAGAERIIAVARYAADDSDQCEFAVAVADAWQCLGVGSTLVRLLFDHAAQQGYRTIYGTILADNPRMVELAQWLGLTIDRSHPDEATVRAWRRLDRKPSAPEPF